MGLSEVHCNDLRSLIRGLLFQNRGELTKYNVQVYAGLKGVVTPCTHMAMDASHYLN